MANSSPSPSRLASFQRDGKSLHIRPRSLARREATNRTPPVTTAPSDLLPLTEADARQRAEHFIASIPPYPGGYQGRGIVICAGGSKYFPSAWVCLRMLRRLGCTLPVQFWHLGPGELDERMRTLVSPYQVECIDARQLSKRKPARILGGWELKAYALLHCPFREVMLLDADNVPVVDPSVLFDTPEYHACGALFWPDHGRLAPDRDIWRLCGIDYRDEPEFESGQIVLNKEVTWRALCLAHWYNEYSDFFNQHIYGDKETFHLAFRKLDLPYAMPGRGIHQLRGTMCQHDFAGRRVFQHRNMAKWNLHGYNPFVVDFFHEAECRSFLEELAAQWDGEVSHVPRFAFDAASVDARLVARELTTKDYVYHRVGYDQRPMDFLPDGLVGRGEAGAEVYWSLEARPDGWHLALSSQTELTCDLRREADGVWRGRWERHERMPIEISPLHGNAATARKHRLFVFTSGGEAALEQRFLNTLKDLYAISICMPPPSSGAEHLGEKESLALFKLQKLVECIEHYPGETLLAADTDLQFFEPTLGYVQCAIGYHDLAVLREHGSGIGLGLLVIKCSARTLNFFRQARSQVAGGRGDIQEVISAMLRAGELNWSYLDQRLWTYHPEDRFPPAGLVVHRVAGCEGAKAKLAQMERVTTQVAKLLFTPASASVGESAVGPAPMECPLPIADAARGPVQGQPEKIGRPGLVTDSLNKGPDGPNPRRLILRNFFSPGDIVMMTAGVRDLHLSQPGRFLTDVRTSCPPLWENNPYLTVLDESDPDARIIDCEYPLIHRCNTEPWHFVHGFSQFLSERLDVPIRPTLFKGDLHLSADERGWMSRVQEITQVSLPFWIVAAGGKRDFTIKWWSHPRFQAVVDHFRERILFVQVGEGGHAHPPLRGVLDLRGQTDHRQLVRLVYHSQGVLCPVTFLMHLAAAVPTAPGMPLNRPCVVVAGGREPSHWEAYTHHQFLHTNGALWCCANGGCWKARTVPLEDGDEKDRVEHLCADVVPAARGRESVDTRRNALMYPREQWPDLLPRCMDMLGVADVARRIELSFEGGTTRYLTPEQLNVCRNMLPQLGWED